MNELVKQTVEDILYLDPSTAQTLGDVSKLNEEAYSIWRRRLMAIIRGELGITEDDARHNLYFRLFSKTSLKSLTCAEAIALVGAARAYPNELRLMSVSSLE